MPHIPQWSHTLSVRNARLDEQHIVLIELSKELMALVRRAPPTDEPILQALREFADLAGRHDELEEGLLAANGCPTLEEHRAIHHLAEAELDRWMVAAASESLDRKALMDGLDGWMAHHLTETDMPVKGYMHD
jgi:hemerythrin-like metal-binding protein